MKQVILARPLSGAPMAEDFALVDAPAPACPPGGLIVRTLYVSLDPYVGSTMRGRHMGHPATPVGSPPPGAGVGVVLESQASGFSVGDRVIAEIGWREIAGIPSAGVRKVPDLGAPLSTHLGVLGMPGLTAFAGAVRLGGAREGDRVLVSAAAGPVGATFGQIARLQGATRVVGIAGGAQKCRLVVEHYGFDACVDYKRDGWRDEIARQFPDGVTLYIENVGHDTLMVALANLALGGRIILCGLAAHYHAEQPAPGIPIGPLVGKRAHVHGLVVYDFYPEQDDYARQAAKWMAQGKLAYAEDRAEGLIGAPALMERLMMGRNIGKAIVAVAPETP